jgi:carboxyl-terminal processing protease
MLIAPSYAQSVKDIRAQGEEMLRAVRKTIEKNYFDPAFSGVNLDALFQKAENSIQQAQSPGQTFGIIAQALTAFHDSHTFFIPPSRIAHVNYGWRMAMVGDRCLVKGVKPKSDADLKGVRAGDEILNIDGFRPTRDNLWRMKFAYYALQPRTTVRLQVGSPDGAMRQVEIAASVKPGKQIIDLVGSTAEFEYWDMLRDEMAEAAIDPHKTYTIGKELIIYRMPDFSIESGELDNVMERIRKYDRLILDLRGNGGGAVSVLERVAGYLLGKGVVVAERKGRKTEKPITAQAPGARVEAKLILLVDSESASAAELLARAVQLEKRGTVIGDRTSGAVRQSREYSLQLGVSRVVMYGVSVTNADLIMKDGKSLEQAGVIPDEIVLNTPATMAAAGDATLARAAEMLGVKLSVEDAGKIFPQKWMN